MGADTIFLYLLSFLVAFIITFVSTPIAKRAAFKIGAVDIPGDSRRMHKETIARFGGAAIVAGFLISLAFQAIASIFGDGIIAVAGREVAGLTAGIVIIVAVGVVDDIKRLKAWIKFIVQVVAAIVFVMISDARITSITNPFSSIGYTVLPDFLSYPITIIWIIGITNAINFIDGLDGLAAGVASISSLSLFFVSVLGGDSNLFAAVITVMLAGCALGFLPFNFSPAKIIMGDTGAYFLGFVLGAVSIQGTMKSYATISLAIPLLVLGLPLFDTLFAIIRRLLSGASPMAADRGHLHHRLMDMGLSCKQSVVIMYIASAVLGLCAVVLANRGVLSAIILLVAVSVFVLGGARYMSGVVDKSNSENGQEAANADEGSLNGAKPPEADHPEGGENP